jgi:hypothetical protein
VPVMALAQRSGLLELADEHLGVPTDKGANAGAKIGSLVAGMVSGADSISDLNRVRHGAMATLFHRPYAPSTLGSFLRQFTFGHVRQLDAVASRFLDALAQRTPVVAGITTGRVLVDIDDSIIEVHGHGKQGSGYGYSGVRGLNSLITTVTTGRCAPVILGQRLRKGSCGSPRGAARMVTDSLTAVGRLRTAATASTNPEAPSAVSKPLLRADSTFYGHPHPRCRSPRRRGRVGDHRVEFGDPDRDHGHRRRCLDPDRVHPRGLRRRTGRVDLARRGRRDPLHRVHRPEESAPHCGPAGRAPHPDLRPRNDQGQGQLFDVWRFHAFFTTTDPADLDTVAADATHRQHAIIEQVHADLKNSALAHMPSGQFCANAAWLVCAVMAFNLTRAAATLTADPKLIRATSGTIRDALITVPARIASSARRLTMHLPTGWQWERSWMTLFEKSFGRNHPILA